jgi:hypothetical protein
VIFWFRKKMTGRSGMVSWVSSIYRWLIAPPKIDAIDFRAERQLSARTAID